VDIRQVNSVLLQAIIGFQESELEESVYIVGKPYRTSATGEKYGSGFHVPSPEEFKRYSKMHLAKHFERIYGSRIIAIASELDKKFKQKYPKISIRATGHTFGQDVSKKLGPQFQVSIFMDADDGKSKDVPKIAKDVAKTLRTKIGGKAFKGRFTTEYYGTGGLAPLKGWLYTMRYYPHADKMEGDPAFESVGVGEAR